MAPRIKVNVTELKVKAAALAALAVSVIGGSLLAGTATDFVETLPDWAEVAGFSLIQAGLVWLAGWKTRNVTGKLAQSTIDAAEKELGNVLAKPAPHPRDL